MATLIAVEAPDGTLSGSCDAKCYNAMRNECNCSCEGALHGVGREAAIERARELAADAGREREAAAELDPSGTASIDADRLVFFLPGPEPEVQAEWEAEAG
jgi:hypothetical protein